MDCATFFSTGRGKSKDLWGGDGVVRGGAACFPRGRASIPETKLYFISPKDGCVFCYAGGDSVRGGGAGNHAHLSGQVPLTPPHHGSLEKHHYDHNHHISGAEMFATW